MPTAARITALGVLLSTWASTAEAQETEHRLAWTFPAEAQETEHRLAWTFPEMRPAEYGALLFVPIAFLMFDHAAPQPTEARWSSSNAFDDVFLSALGDSSEHTRDTADLVGTITWQIVRAYPLIDAALVPAFDGWNFRVAWQMAAIDVTAMVLQAFLKLVLVRAFARHRPSTMLCLDRGGTDAACLADNTKSFPSGHTMSAFTGAGLACAAHTAMPLYGSEAADATACGAALALAATTGISRVIADKHYMSDVLVGAALGLSVGWLLPYLLHYGSDAPAPSDTALTLVPFADLEPSDAPAPSDTAVALVPFADLEPSVGLSALGRF